MVYASLLVANLPIEMRPLDCPFDKLWVTARGDNLTPNWLADMFYGTKWND